MQLNMADYYSFVCLFVGLSLPGVFHIDLKFKQGHFSEHCLFCLIHCCVQNKYDLFSFTAS